MSHWTGVANGKESLWWQRSVESEDSRLIRMSLYGLIFGNIARVSRISNLLWKLYSYLATSNGKIIYSCNGAYYYCYILGSISISEIQN
jgi:hypothetical protein